MLKLLQWALVPVACSWPALLVYHLWVAGYFTPRAPGHDVYFIVHFGSGHWLSLAAAVLALALLVWRRTSSQGT